MGQFPKRTLLALIGIRGKARWDPILIPTVAELEIYCGAISKTYFACPHWDPWEDGVGSHSNSSGCGVEIFTKGEFPKGTGHFAPDVPRAPGRGSAVEEASRRPLLGARATCVCWERTHCVP